MRRRIDAQSEQMGQLRERMARLEGLLEGLREAFARRVAWNRLSLAEPYCPPPAASSAREPAIMFVIP